MSNPIRQRRMQANYLKVPNEATPQLLGVGAKTLNENPAAQTKSRRYVCDSSTTRSISGYDWSTAYEIDQIRSQKAIEYIVSIGENQLTGEDAETEYFIVDLDKPYTTGSGNEQVISTTVFHARKFNIAVEVASYTNDDGEMGCTGNFLAKGDPVEGYFNTSTGVFSVEASVTSETPAETPAVTEGN